MAVAVAVQAVDAVVDGAKREAAMGKRQVKSLLRIAKRALCAFSLLCTEYTWNTTGYSYALEI